MLPRVGTECTIRVIGAADGSPTPHDGRYVVAWNPHTKAGVLELTSTPDRNSATLFEISEALEQRHTISRVQPFRPWDGKLNRPLTGIAVVFEEVDSS